MYTTKETLVTEDKINTTELNDDDVLYGIKEPNRSCKICHGLGRSAFDEQGEPVLCTCLKRNGKGDWITLKEFRSICNKKRADYEGLNNDSRFNKVHSPEASSESKET